MKKALVRHKFYRVLNDMADSVGLASVPLNADALADSALRAARRTGFRDMSFMAPLRLLLECYEREADLNVFGRYAAKWDALRCLSNILRFEAEEELGPVLKEEIKDPLFITGMPRAGTTLLHALLAEDPAALAPRCWETISPYPNQLTGRDRRQRQVESQLRMFQRLAPEMAVLHPITADAPQECTEITAQVFQSIRYEATHRVPTYKKWLDANGHLQAYRFHKRFLQHLQHQRGRGRWVLKCPDHVHALEAIDAVYPDNRLVFVHRDPLRVIASAAKLTEVLRRPLSRIVDKKEIGEQVLGRMREAAEIMERRAANDDGKKIHHLHYVKFAADPLGAVETLYAHFGLSLGGPARARMSAYLDGIRRHKNTHSLEEFGLDPAQVCVQFRSYMNRFEIQPEFATWKEMQLPYAPIAA